MRFDTFNEVKKWYDETKPIISKNHTAADDIRPINNRKYKWERIVKINENKYALVDGSWTGMNWATDPDVTRDFNRELADKLGTILWEKRPDGEYIHIRGSVNGGYAISRYKMLNYCLPWSLRHHDSQPQGKHWIVDSSAGITPYNQYPLPRMKAKIDWHGHKINSYEDNSLTFKRIEDEHGRTTAWERIGGVEVQDTKLDLERKKQLRPAINSFYEWMSTMQPLIPRGYDADAEFRTLMAEGLGIPNFWGGRSADQITPEFALQVITNQDSPYRLAFAATLLRWIEVRPCPGKHQDKYKAKYDDNGRYIGGEEIKGAPFTEEETALWYKTENTRIKTSYNRYMNKLLGLFKTTTV